MQEQRSQPPGGILAAALRCIGAQQRSERRDLHRQVRPRDRTARIALEQGPLGPAGRRLRQFVECLPAALRVAVGLGLGYGRLTEQVERRHNAGPPQVAEDRTGRVRRLRDYEPVRHVPHRGGGRRAERAPPRRAARHPHGHAQRLRLLLDVLQVGAQVAGEVVERAGGGGHVHQAKQGGAQLRVLGRALHRLRVQRAEWMAGAGRKRGRQRAADLAQLGLHGGLAR